DLRQRSSLSAHSIPRKELPAAILAGNLYIKSVHKPTQRRQVCFTSHKGSAMPNRQLTNEELKTLFTPLMADVRQRLDKLSGGDKELLWAIRRKLFKELAYDERGKPMQRK